MGYGWSSGYGRGRGMGGRGGRGGGRGYGWRRGAGFQPPTVNPLPPPAPGVFRVVVTASDGGGLESVVAPRFGRAPYIVVVDISNGRVVDVKSMENPFISLQHGVGIAFSQWLIASGVRAIVTPSVGPHASMVLQQAGVMIYSVQPGVRVADALKSVGLVV